ncbi:MAG: hypothetical protein WAV32_01325 [Halobacteriota archaeon]
MNEGEDENAKAILVLAGIALAAIAFAAVAMLMLGSTAAYSTGGKYNIIVKQTPAQKVLIGQDLQFRTADGWTTAPTIYRYVSGDLSNTYPATTGTDGNHYIYNVNWQTSGAYYVNGNATTKEAQLSVEDPKIPLQLKVKNKIVSSLARSTPIFHTDVGGINLFPDDRVDLVIMGPGGRILTKNNQNFKGINVSTLTGYTSDNYIDTTGWDIGHYTFQVKTKPEYACGLDVQSPLRELDIIIAAITITAEPAEVPELKTVKLTVTGVAGMPINVREDTLSLNAYFPEGLNDNQGPKNNNFNDTIDSDGTRTYAVEFDDIGTYTIKVTYQNDPPMYDTADITVIERAVNFDVPGTVVIGQRFMIKGTANTGNTVTVAVDDEVVPKLNNIVIDENGEFAEEIDTSSDAAPGAFKIPGSVRLKAYIDYNHVGTVPAGKTDDGSVAILMTRGELTAELSTKSVAKGDEFTITGKAKGSKNVNILIVAPKGFCGSNIETNAKEMYYTSTSVTTTDDSFYKKITVNDDVNCEGKYLIMILSAGGDGKWGKSGYDTLYNPNDPWNSALGQYTLCTRTQEGMLAIIDDMMSLSDDLIWVGYVTVGEKETLSLNPIADVVTGDSLVVTGNSSRKEGTIIWITVKGRYGEIVPQAAYVKDNGFKVTFDTAGAYPGTYTVQAIDGYGCTATTGVHITASTSVPTSFDTGAGSYPSMMGTHNGTITIQRRQWWW